MELLLVAIGIFIILAMAGNKQVRGDKKNGEFFSFMVGSLALFPLLSGLGFLYPPSTSLVPNHSLLIPMWMFAGVISIKSTGPIKVMSRVAWVAFMTYVIMGSFM